MNFLAWYFLSLNFSHCRYTVWLLLYMYIVDLVKSFLFKFHDTINGE